MIWLNDCCRGHGPRTVRGMDAHLEEKVATGGCGMPNARRGKGRREFGTRFYKQASLESGDGPGWNGSRKNPFALARCARVRITAVAYFP